MSDPLSTANILRHENEMLRRENEELCSIVRACRESVWADMKMAERLQKRVTARHLRSLLDRIDGQSEKDTSEIAGEVAR